MRRVPLATRAFIQNFAFIFHGSVQHSTLVIHMHLFFKFSITRLDTADNMIKMLQCLSKIVGCCHHFAEMEPALYEILIDINGLQVWLDCTFYQFKIIFTQINPQTLLLIFFFLSCWIYCKIPFPSMLLFDFSGHRFISYALRMVILGCSWLNLNRLIIIQKCFLILIGAQQSIAPIEINSGILLRVQPERIIEILQTLR